MSLDVFRNASKVDNHRAEVDAALDSFTRMLAAEDIVVIRGNFQTASFDIKNRVCRIPDWKKMSHSLQVLFRAHEMGHALYTTQTDFHDWVETKPDRKMFPYFNIVEDVRIERMIQAQFPGLTRSFHSAYRELMELNFFGDIIEQDMIFIDRINVNTKLGEAWYPMTFKNETERELYARLQFIRSFEDAMTLAQDIFNYAINDEPDLDNAEPQSQPNEPEEGNTDEGQEADGSDSGEEDESGEEGSELSESLGGDDAESTDEDSTEDFEQESQTSSQKGESMTDDMFRDAEQNTLNKNDPTKSRRWGHNDPIIMELDGKAANVSNKSFVSTDIFTTLGNL